MTPLLVAGAVALGAAGPALAQDMRAQDFVDQAATSGMFEVQSSELALDRSQNPDVRGFAEQMIADHRPANEELTAIAEEEGLHVPSEMTGEAAVHMQAVEAAEGERFDGIYVDHQVAAHEAAVELFQSYVEQGDVEPLVSFAESTLPTLQQHLEMAQGLAER